MTILARARVVLEGDTVALTKSLQGATASMQQAGRKMNAIGKSMSLKVTLPILAVGAAATKAFADFDNKMNQSIAIMGDVSDTMRDKMEAAAKDVARTTTIGASTAAEAYFFLASAGLSAEQSVAALPQVARFAQAGMFNMATATDLATDAQSALGLTVDNAQQNLINLTRVTDVLVKANTLANASVMQFSEALTREAGAALKTFNIDMEEGVAVLAAFADQGVKSQIAGTALARILRLMTGAATKHAVELEDLKIEVFDAEGAIRNFADILEDMEVVFGAMSDEQRTAALESIGFTAKVQGILLPLLGTSKAIREYEEGLREAGGTTKRVSDIQLRSFSAQLKIVWNQIVLAGEAAGKTMAPAVLKLAAAARTAAHSFEEMNEGLKITILVLGGLIAVVGPALLVLGGMTLAVAKLVTGLKLLLVPAAGATRALVLLRAAVSPGGLLIVGLGWLAVKLFRASIAAREASRAMKDANAKFEESLGLLTPQVAARTADRLSASVDNLKERYRALQLELASATATEGIVADATRNVIQANIEAVEILRERGRRSKAEVEEEIADLEELIKTQERHIAILRVAAGLAEPEEAPGVDTGGVEGAGEGLLRLKEAMASLVAQMDATVKMNELFGDSFNLAEEQAAALEAGIGDLVMAGAEFTDKVGPNGETLQELAIRYLALRAEIEATEKAQVALTKVEEDAKAIIEAMLTPLERYDQKMLELKAHLDANRLTQEQYNRAVAEAEAMLDGAGEKGKEWGQLMERTIENAFQGFIDWTKGAEDAFRDFADSVIRELQRVSAKFLAAKIFGAIVSADVEGKAAGGFVGGGRIALVGEAGPELIQAGRSGVTVAPLRGMEFSAAGIGGPAPNINVTIQAVDARSFAELAEANPGAIAMPLVQALRRSSALQGALFK